MLKATYNKSLLCGQGCHLEGVPVLGLDLAALHGQGGVEVVRQRGQRRLARVQLRLAADLATLQVEVRLRVLQPRPTALLPGDEVLIER